MVVSQRVCSGSRATVEPRPLLVCCTLRLLTEPLHRRVFWVVPLADSCSAAKWRGAVEFRAPIQRSHANVRKAGCWYCGQLMSNIVWP